MEMDLTRKVNSALKNRTDNPLPLAELWVAYGIMSDLVTEKDVKGMSPPLDDYLLR